MMSGIKGRLGVMLVAGLGIVGLADNSDAQEARKPAKGTKPPAATVAANTRTTPVATRSDTSRTKQSPARTGEAAAEQLPEVNQALVDDMTRDWGTVVPQGREQDFQRQLERLLDAYRRNDREAWERLNQRDGVRTRSFDTERAAFAGGSMKFIGEIDGFETNTGRTVRCFCPVDTEGKRIGTDFHYMVTGLDGLSTENVVYIIESGTLQLEGNEGMRQAMQVLSQRFSRHEPKQPTKSVSATSTASTRKK